MRFPSMKLLRVLLAVFVAVIICLGSLNLFTAITFSPANAATGTNYPNCGPPTMITLSQFEAGNLNLNPNKNSLNHHAIATMSWMVRQSVLTHTRETATPILRATVIFTYHSTAPSPLAVFSR